MELTPLGGCRRELIDQAKAKLFTGFASFDGQEICFYMSIPDGAEDWVFSDCCGFLRDAARIGVAVRPAMLASLAGTFGLKITDEMNLFDDTTDLPEDFRALRFTQCLVALDGCLRMWGASAPTRIQPEEVKDVDTKPS